jgi:hypothetical protein
VFRSQSIGFINSAWQWLSNATPKLINQRSIKEASNRVFLASLHFHLSLTFQDFVLWPQSIGGINSAWQRLSNVASVLIAAPKLINQWSIKEASNRVFLASFHFHLSLTFQDFVFWPQSIGGKT